MSGSDRLKIFLKKIGKTQQEFARDVGLTQGAISDIIRGKTPSVSESVAKLCRYLYNANPAWLLTGSGDMFISSQSHIADTDEPFSSPKGISRKPEFLRIITDFEQVALTEWFEQLPGEKKNIITGLCEIKDKEILENISDIITSQVARERAEEKLQKRLDELENGL